MASPTILLVYPDTLPNPSVSMTLGPVERRMLNAPPLTVRAFEEGFRGVVKVHFQYTATQAEVFRAWWSSDLEKGMNWFTASWPNAYGFTPKVYRFKPNSMTWSYNGFEYYVVETDCYARGLSLPPTG